MGTLMRLATGGLYGGRKKEPRAKVREIKRTCDRCGNEWYVTPAEVKMRAPSGLTVAGLKMQSAGNRHKVIGGKKKAIIAEQRISRAQDQADRVERINRCSSCGSVTFTESSA